jgi:3-hydroxyisobutyrate dehydrogenase-like beta-hydroxyacid dehydrogenase
MKVAFIGLGNMGSGIANCILKAGFDTTDNRIVTGLPKRIPCSKEQGIILAEQGILW